MKETAVIEFDVRDRDVLLVIFERFKVSFKMNETPKKKSLSKEDKAIQQRLHTKFVVTGLWENMNDEAREDAAHAESMIYAQEQPNNEVYTPERTKAYLTELRQKLTHAD